jgi:hypothetical protein
MSKIKMSFSLIIALLLVGIMSTAVFAATYTSYGLSVAKNAATTGFTVTVNRITGTNDTLKLQQFTSTNPTAPFGNKVESDLTSWNSDQATVNVNNATVGTIYKFVVVDSTGKALTKPKYATYYTSLGQKMASVGNDPEGLVDVDGSGIVNSNHTLTDPVRKTDFRNTKNQKLHGFYQNNTNSCASCHETHTANQGEALLFKDGTYSTCSSCHDGTTGAYNAFSPAGQTDPNEIVGTFNTQPGHNGSLHQADGSLEVSAAPGGNHDAAANSIATATYGGEFDCASCHAPHGGGSAGENNLNLDPLGWGGIAYSTASKDAQNGKLFKSAKIYTPTTLPTDKTPFILVKTTATGVTTDKTKAGYLYSRAGLSNGDPIIQTYRWDGQKYVADYSLWLRSTGHVSAPFENANTFFKDASGADITNTLNVVWRDGFAAGAVDNVATAQFSIGIDVETPTTLNDPSKSDVAALVDSTNKDYVYDAGTEMSKYCAACHVDYLSTTRGNETGTYTIAHRHATAQDRLSCVRCHFAHGSDAQIMKDANDETYNTLQTNYGFTADQALNYLLDPNPSSAIKRYTGMAVCYACHGKGEAFMANPNVNTDRTTGAVSGPYLKSGDPGAARTNRTDVPVVSSFK